MSGIDLIASFELEINKIDDIVEKPVTDDSIYWINQAVMKFVKDRFNGNAPKRTSYEQNEKRTRDLVKLFCQVEIPVTQLDTNHANYDAYTFTYPTNPKMLYVLNEDVVISDLNDEYLMDTCVFECTADSFMYRINNSLTDFHYRHHRARPLRVRTANGFKLLTDKNYKISSYTVGYLKVPTEITSTDPFVEYEDFEDNVWAEIVKIAA